MLGAGEYGRAESGPRGRLGAGEYGRAESGPRSIGGLANDAFESCLVNAVPGRLGISPAGPALANSGASDS